MQLAFSGAGDKCGLLRLSRPRAWLGRHCGLATTMERAEMLSFRLILNQSRFPARLLQAGEECGRFRYLIGEG
jgi:hypothetical protein